jgi:GT2 family glycosyltransferase
VSGAPPSVTIVIPTFDRVDLLGAAIDSVLAQDHPELELLVLDDGSTDSTPELLRAYAERGDARFRWNRHENVGQARTLNRGFEEARGELVGYLSSDDLLQPGAVAALAAPFAGDPETVVSYGGWEYFSSDDEHLDTVMPVEFTLEHAFANSDPVIGPGSLVRTELARELGGWDPRIRFSGDFEFWLRAARHGRFARVGEVLARYRWHEGMTGRSTTGLALVLERLAIVDANLAVPELADRLAPLADRAYRSALLVGAGLAGSNDTWERFFLADRLDNRIFQKRRAGLAGRAAELRSEIADREVEIASLGRRVGALGDTFARRTRDQDR